MRRNMWLVLAAVAGIAGCKGGGGDVVATADKEELSAEWIADVVHSAKGIQPSIKASAWLADLWVDLSLFAQGAAADKLSDSTTIAEAMWFQTMQFRLAHWHDSLLAERVKISDAQMDSAAKALDMRNGQHILLLTMGKTKAEEAAARKKIEGLLAQAKSGADFGELAAANSEDNSKTNQGWLGASVKATWVPEFSASLWSLQPGAISGVVKTQFGYHIIRRGTAAESDSLIRAAVRDSIVGTQGASIAMAYIQEISDQRKLEVTKDAATLVKAALNDLNAKRNDKTKIASFEGGVLTVADFVKWFHLALASPEGGMDMKDQLLGANDSIVTGFVKQLGANQILDAVALEHKIGLTPKEWDELKKAYLVQVDSLKAHMGLDQLGETTGGARSDSAAAIVMEFFRRVQMHETNLLPAPGQLPYVLRGRYKVKIYADGLQKSVDLAIAKNAADSMGAAPAPAGGDQPVVQPATGGPPVGGTPPTTPPPAGGGKP